MSEVAPRVFVSYSHDTAPHKEWVLDFASTLRKRGIDVVLDQWDLKPGNDLLHFMETELVKADYIVVVCTENYVAKANSGKGGVGYEKGILSDSMMKGISQNKVIPILRGTGETNLPTFLSSKLYINFSKDDDVEYNLDNLLRTLLDAPLYEKPKIGSNPFQPLTGSKPDRTADGLKAAMTAIANAFAKNHEQTIGIGIIMQKTTMHRLTLEKYLIQAEKNGLISQDIMNRFSVTEKGFEYLMDHEIIEE